MPRFYEPQGGSVTIDGVDAIVILPTMDLSTDQKNSFNYGSSVSVTFSGKAVHLFNKETEKNLEF